MLIVKLFLSLFLLLVPYELKADLPDFLILGVTKCGTTSLFDYLTQHENIVKGASKELHYFDSGVYGLAEGKDDRWYINQFPSRVCGKITGEATPCYFWKQRCDRRIYTTFCEGIYANSKTKKVRFIVILRDPVARMISDYAMLCRRGKELNTFEDAIKSREMYERYFLSGIYIQHVRKWLTLFPREQFLFLIAEDMFKDPVNEVNKVFRFLGLEECTLPSYSVSNSGDNKPAVSEDLLRTLYDFYAPYNAELEVFLGRELPWKMKQSAQG